MKVLMAITCYRCERQIVRVLRSLAHSSLASEMEAVVLFDNQSPDQTAEVAKAMIQDLGLTEKISVYRNRENYGLGGSQKLAFQMAEKMNTDWVLVFHGDDQASIADIPNFFLQAQRDVEVCAILGSRFSVGSRREGYQLKRIIGNRILNLIYSFVTGRWTSDLGSGLNMFRVEALKKIPYMTYNDQFTFNVDLLLGFYRAKLRCQFLPILWRESDQSSNARNFSVAFQMLRQLFRWRVGFRGQNSIPKNFGSDLL